MKKRAKKKFEKKVIDEPYVWIEDKRFSKAEKKELREWNKVVHEVVGMSIALDRISKGYNEPFKKYLEGRVEKWMEDIRDCCDGDCKYLRQLEGSDGKCLKYDEELDFYDWYFRCQKCVEERTKLNKKGERCD
jgi:hypothetical protein